MCLTAEESCGGDLLRRAAWNLLLQRWATSHNLQHPPRSAARPLTCSLGGKTEPCVFPKIHPNLGAEVSQRKKRVADGISLFGTATVHWWECFDKVNMFSNICCIQCWAKQPGRNLHSYREHARRARVRKRTARVKVSDQLKPADPAHQQEPQLPNPLHSCIFSWSIFCPHHHQKYYQFNKTNKMTLLELI